METIKVVVPKEESDLTITFSVSKSFDFMISDILNAVHEERGEYINTWLNEKTNAVSKLGCEWRLWVPYDKETFSEIYTDIPEELEDIFHAAYIYAQDIHLETGDSMILVLFTEA